jgi:hypothetical protein
MHTDAFPPARVPEIPPNFDYCDMAKPATAPAQQVSATLDKGQGKNGNDDEPEAETARLPEELDPGVGGRQGVPRPELDDVGEDNISESEDDVDGNHLDDLDELDDVGFLVHHEMYGEPGAEEVL